MGVSVGLRSLLRRFQRAVFRTDRDSIASGGRCPRSATDPMPVVQSALLLPRPAVTDLEAGPFRSIRERRVRPRAIVRLRRFR